MELDSFLATPRWEILKIIIEKPSSPMEVAEQISATNSFVSQQLKLLEAAGLVKKEKTGAFEKGKPRTLFSIKEESLYIIPLAKNAPDKKLIPLSKEQKAIINIWNIENQQAQKILQKFFWAIEKFLPKITQISSEVKGSAPKVFIVSKDTSLTHKINEAQKNFEDKVDFKVLPSSAPLEKKDEVNLFSIYTADENSAENFDLKGSLEKDE